MCDSALAAESHVSTVEALDGKMSGGSYGTGVNGGAILSDGVAPPD